MSGRRLILSSLCAGITFVLLASHAEARALPPLTGTFGGNATGQVGYSGTVSQALSPDNGALSILFENLKVEEQSGSKRRSSSYYVLNVPLSPVSAGKVTAYLRGAINVGAGSKCTLTLNTDSGQVRYQATRSKPIFLRKSIDVLPGDSEITISIAVSCEGKPEKAVYIAQVDSLDLAWSRKHDK